MRLASLALAFAPIVYGQTDLPSGNKFSSTIRVDGNDYVGYVQPHLSHTFVVGKDQGVPVTRFLRFTLGQSNDPMPIAYASVPFSTLADKKSINPKVEYAWENGNFCRLPYQTINYKACSDKAISAATKGLDQLLSKYKASQEYRQELARPIELIKESDIRVPK